MHRGVQALIGWMEQHRQEEGVTLGPPATTAELHAVEDRILSPLPADLSTILRRCNGARLPSGHLLAANDEDGDSIQRVLRDLAAAMDRAEDDPEVLLPFFRNDDGGILAFDRSAGPLADTWPIVDYYPDNGELRLVHRTFDGFCRVCVANWNADDFAEPFSLERYLREGKRHAQIEPDVSVAHATVAHALRRAGRPEQALRRYLRAARCVPALPWCDWEALKIAAMLGDVRAVMESASRLCVRAPSVRWAQRETSPVQVADVLCHVAGAIRPQELVLRLLDQLATQALDSDGKEHVTTIRRALFEMQPLPPPRPIRPCAVPLQSDAEAWWDALRAAYEAGSVRDDDLLLEPAYAPLRARPDYADVLRIPRLF